MSRTPTTNRRKLVKSLAIAASLLLAIAPVEARPGKGSSAGSRGSQTYSAPPTTNTAPRQAQPLPGSQMQNPGSAASAATSAPRPGSRFGGGLLGGLAAGFLGAGLFGLLSGSGFMSGLGSMMGLLGLLLQVGLVVLAVRFAMNYFRKKQPEAAVAGNAPGTFARQPVQPEWKPQGGAMGVSAPVAKVETQPIQPVEADFNSFERLLGEIQDAYGRNDRTSLSQRVTAEMNRHFNGELDDLARNGLVNKISGVKLLQGDLAEAWREPGAEYATVAMRYAIIDATVEKATGKLVDGDLTKTQEVTEIWTFVRRPGEGPQNWILSAIQQA